MTTSYYTPALTEKQQLALAALSPSQFKSATDLGVAPASLSSLVKAGLADVKSQRIQSSNPRQRVSSEPILRSYRITGRGVIVLRKIQKAAA